MIATLLLVCAGYLLVGVIIGFLFLLFGIARVDKGADGAGLAFKMIIFPGLILLWPIILGRWFSGQKINQDIHAGEGL